LVLGSPALRRPIPQFEDFPEEDDDLDEEDKDFEDEAEDSP
jgi:hypothetical protein